MVVFAFETKETVELLKFVFETNVRLEEKGIVKNPFYGRITLVPLTAKNKIYTYVVNLEPVYPKIYVIGSVLTLMTFLLAGARWTPWLWPGIILMSTIFLWSKYFYFIFIILGLKKSGHTNKLKLITDKETIIRLIDSIL